MSVLNKQIVLVLNKLWIPIGTTTPKKAIVSLCSSSDGVNAAAKVVDIEPDYNLDGSYNFEKPKFINLLSWEEWIKLEIRPIDMVINSARYKIRVPHVIVVQNYSDIPIRKLKPTSKNVMERYNYRCCYTNKVLPKHLLNLEHPTPVSRNGAKNNWKNIAPCDKRINSKKGNKTPEEAGLKLQYELKEPNPVPNYVFINKSISPFWAPFLIK